MHGEVMRKFLLGFLWIDGFLVGILGVAFLQLSIGSVAFPISALAAGLANYVLLWFSATLTAGPAKFGALVAFAVAFFVSAAGGPGGDAVIPQDWRSFLLLALGVAAPMFAGYAGLLPASETPPVHPSKGGRE
ncbi:hypothetical protein BFL43_08580 [Williamsia sp. 1135]|nr:hypothetical protein BFL43_08580 [Williamsia sp. 1135]